VNKTVLTPLTILCLLITVFLMGYKISMVASLDLPIHNIDTGLDYATIQEAINANETAHGHTICVDAGSYYENVVVNKSVSLVGESRETTIVDGGIVAGVVTSITVDNVSMVGFTVRSSRHYESGPSSIGIALGEVKNCNVSGNKIAKNDYGIKLGSSSSNNITGNNITANGRGIYLVSSISNRIVDNYIFNNGIGIWFSSSSDNNSVLRNNITANRGSGLELRASSHNSIANNTFVKDGLYVYESYANVVDDNLVNGKPLIYLEEVSDYTVKKAGQVILVNCRGMLVENLELSNTDIGVELWMTSNTEITRNNMTGNDLAGIWLFASSNNNIINDNNITANRQGMWFSSSSNNNSVLRNNITANRGSGITIYSCSSNVITRNNITENDAYGVSTVSSNYNIISGNKIAKNERGFEIMWSFNNTVVRNDVANSSEGIKLYDSWNNSIYHNNFMENTFHIWTAYSVNTWDDGYPSGGNYWSDYNGTDLSSGLYQNETGSDGIGDTPYVVKAQEWNIHVNQDNYPLRGMFSEFNATSEQCVQTVCNSSLSDFQFSGTAIRFNVTGENGTAGFCRMCIPTSLMSGPYQVFVNGTEVSHDLLPISNSTHSYIYFSYEHSTKEVVIVPEFPSFLILPLFIITTLLAVRVYRRNHSM
jgi:parallel beta-helix repeat protein